jgi:hypothetical protein
MAEGEQGMILRHTPHARENSGVSTGDLGLSAAIRPNLRIRTTRSIASFDKIHPHTNDLGHPDTFDCNARCIGAKRTQGGVCTAVSGPPPCATSAMCECR